MPLGQPADVILCDNQAATGAGTGVIGFGQEIRYAKGAGVNRNKYPKKFKVRGALSDTTTGATATITIQHCDDAATWTTLGTLSLAINTTSVGYAATRGLLFSTTKRYVRANVTALAGGSAPKVDAYLTLGTFGA